MTPRSTKEVELGPPVISWLEASGYDVFQEVGAWAGIADIVGRQGPIAVVCELKLQFSWELLAQAKRWQTTAHQVWVAVPYGKRTDGRVAAEEAFGDAGIGILSVWAPGSEGSHISVTCRPRFNRHADASKTLKYLRPEQKTFKLAGSPNGAHWTEFRSACSDLKAMAEGQPGILLGDALAGLPTDSAANARIATLLRANRLEGVRAERDGRALRLYATEASAA